MSSEYASMSSFCIIMELPMFGIKICWLCSSSNWTGTRIVLACSIMFPNCIGKKIGGALLRLWMDISWLLISSTESSCLSPFSIISFDPNCCLGCFCLYCCSLVRNPVDCFEVLGCLGILLFIMLEEFFSFLDVHLRSSLCISMDCIDSILCIYGSGCLDVLLYGEPLPFFSSLINEPYFCLYRCIFCSRSKRAF